jgi:hypothetical protein
MVAIDFAVVTSIITSSVGIISILRDIKKDGVTATKERAAMLTELQLLLYRVTRIEAHLENKEENI